jgi:D-tyrosyl-tRNA(Tyr) deacylase
MRAVLQRVSRASVAVEGEVVGEIGKGLLIFVAAGRDDSDSQAVSLANKTAELRIFSDVDGKTNLSLLDVGGSALVISQFTLYADCRRGRRPSFSDAADPGPAEALVERFRQTLEERGVPTAAGRFGADMFVSLDNVGPFTILLDSEELTRPRRVERSLERSGRLEKSISSPLMTET